MSKHNLKVTLDDGYCAHEFPLTNVPGSVSINDAAEALAKSIKATLGESKCVRSIYELASAAAQVAGGKLGAAVKVSPLSRPTVDINPAQFKRTESERLNTLFCSGDAQQDAVVLLDCAYDVMEIWKAEGPYNQSLKKAWMQRARELGAVPSP
jgi:hypothetical protein